ncbi:MAG TPA: hypothetical protein VHC91_11865 [Trinickia sp.]|uniref:hypothetical protein n=1 Tax=Trinickia sp. TaxID=2571163 RepID=UPI002CD0E564|nr:hypothetical protein [Trinickia sp.]HVW51073.1 hypothetical protein [Trinickia sp.]
MDDFVRHQMEGVSVDIQVVPAAPSGFAARFRISGEPGDEADWPIVHVANGPFATALQAEEAAKSAALEHILQHGSPPH